MLDVPTELLELARQPWTLVAGNVPVRVRPATVRDLSPVAAMQRRCSARSLLDRYQQGGRPPGPAALDAELRNADAVVAFVPKGRAVATGAIRPDPERGTSCAAADLLVEDGWQRRGIGTALLDHLAGLAYVAGFTELVAYPATAVPLAQRLMIQLGRTRMVRGADVHLRTFLAEDATLGLGAVRQRLAG